MDVVRTHDTKSARMGCHRQTRSAWRIQQERLAETGGIQHQGKWILPGHIILVISRREYIITIELIAQ
jgi:hypothetical protein